jgi:hypothetical protein
MEGQSAEAYSLGLLADGGDILAGCPPRHG